MSPNIPLVANRLTFLVEIFPSYEIVHDDAQNISSQEFIYVYSLLLFHSCVICANSFFQTCCGSLDPKHQEIVFKFFASLKQAQENKEPITKEVLRLSIKEAVMSSPRLKFVSSSPIKTPDKSSATPSKAFYYAKAKELQRSKAMLENERYERNMMEVELKQYEEKLQSLRKSPQCLVQRNFINLVSIFQLKIKSR